MNIIQSGDIVTIKAPEATYTVIYGIHFRGQNTKTIPENLDYMFLETGGFSWYENPLQCIEDLKNHIQYNPVFRMLEERNISVIFADLKYKFNDIFLLLADNVLTAAQWAIGMRILKNLLKGINEKKKHKISDYITHVGVAGWLLLPFAANMLRLGSTVFGIGQNKTSAFKRFAHKAHPETDILYLNIRNAVIAEKIKYLAEKLGNHPNIGIILGAGHVGIEDMLLQNSEKRIQFLTRWKTILKNLVKEKYVYTITNVSFTGKTWGTTHSYETATLKNLLI